MDMHPEIGASIFIPKADVTLNAISRAWDELRGAVRQYCYEHDITAEEIETVHQSNTSQYDVSTRKWEDVPVDEQGEEVYVVFSSDTRDWKTS